MQLEKKGLLLKGKSGLRILLDLSRILEYEGV